MDKCTHVTFRQRWKIHEMAPSHRWIWTVADNRRYMTDLVPYFKERYQACQARGYASAIILLRLPACVVHMRVEQFSTVNSPLSELVAFNWRYTGLLRSV